MDDTTRRLEEIERRVAELEARLALGVGGAPGEAKLIERSASEIDSKTSEHASPPAGPPLVGQGSAGVTPIVPGADVDERGFPIANPSHVPPPLPARVQAFVAQTGPAELASAARVQGDPNVPPALDYRRASTGARPGLEQMIGLKWAGWIGAVVLVIGAALGFKFAYEQGWLGRLPDEAKLAVMSMGGFAIIVLGEFVLRRVDKLAAAGLFAAGVAILFLASYASYAWYALFAQNTAMTLMAASALVGALLAVRSDLVSIAVLALIGGNIAPIVLNTDQARLAPFLCYLLFLQLMALVLCWWQATPKWWVLRGVSLASTGIWMVAVVVMPDARAQYVLVCAACVFFAALYHLELIATPLRAARRAGTTELASPIDRSVGVIFSVLVTGTFTLWILGLHRYSTANVRGAWVLGTGVFCAGLGFSLLNLSRERLLGLSQSLRVQAVLLLVLAVPVIFEGPAIVFGWMALAVGLAIVGTMGRLTISLVGSAGVWLLAIAAWGVWSQEDAAQKIWINWRPCPFTGQLVVAAMLTICGHLVGVVIGLRKVTVIRHTDFSFRAIGMMVHAGAVILWIATSYELLPPMPATIAIAVLASLLVAVSFIPAAVDLGMVGVLVFAFAATKWVLGDQIGTRLMERPKVNLTPLINVEAVLGIALCVILLVCGLAAEYLARSMRADARKLLREVLLGMVPVLLVLIGSVEIDRYAIIQTAGPEWIVRQVGWSIWWAGAAVAALIVGFARHTRELRLFALGLLGATLIKIVLVDLSGAGTGWRILSFIGLGGVLLGTSVLYGKFGSRMGEREGGVENTAR